MKTSLNFEDKSTKELLSQFDFNFFLEQNISNGKYPQENVNEIHTSYNTTKDQLKLKSKNHKKQLFYFVEGKIRKMFTGGFLPAIFELDESRTHTILDFKGVGESWAYFEYWKKDYKRKLKKEKIWNFIIKIGSVLALLLSLLKLYEIFSK